MNTICHTALACSILALSLVSTAAPNVPADPKVANQGELAGNVMLNTSRLHTLHENCPGVRRRVDYVASVRRLGMESDESMKLAMGAMSNVIEARAQRDLKAFLATGVECGSASYQQHYANTERDLQTSERKWRGRAAPTGA